MRPLDIPTSENHPGQFTPTPETAGSNFLVPGQFQFSASAFRPNLVIHTPKKAARRQKKGVVLPQGLPEDGPFSNEEYRAALVDPDLVFSPQALGFLPSNYWLAVNITFGDLVVKFFQRKNNSNCRFPHKLFNALAVVEQVPAFFRLFGVQWVTDQVIKVDKFVFARLLGITTIDGGLFHAQGNFPSHGFRELKADELAALRELCDSRNVDLENVDLERVRLLYHLHGAFTKGSNEENIAQCKWICEAAQGV
jgi:hypothetical protein